MISEFQLIFLMGFLFGLLFGFPIGYTIFKKHNKRWLTMNENICKKCNAEFHNLNGICGDCGTINEA